MDKGLYLLSAGCLFLTLCVNPFCVFAYLCSLYFDNKSAAVHFSAAALPLAVMSVHLTVLCRGFKLEGCAGAPFEVSDICLQLLPNV